MYTNKSEKIVEWARQNKTRSFAHVVSDLNSNDSATMLMLNRLKRHGLINYTINKSAKGKSVSLAMVY